MQRRNRRSGVEDLWRKRDGSPTQLHGKGMRWRARWVDESGEYARRFRTKVEAQQFLAQITADQVAGTYVPVKAGKITVGEVHGRWSKSQPHIKATTAETRAVTWRKHVGPRWASVPVGEVLTSDVRTWIAELAEAGAGAATIENALGVLRMTLALAVEDRRIPRNPCQGVKTPRRQHSQRGYLTHLQVDALARKVAYRPEVVRFLAYTGLRWGEAAALRVENFDVLRRRVNIVQAVTEVRGELVWSTAKNHERRSVPFPRILVDELAALMEGKSRDALVFAAPAGGVLRVSRYRPDIMAPAVLACQAADPDFPTVTPHDLRHTAASLAIQAQATPKSVQVMLGHKSAALTLDTYSDLFPDDLEAVADALDSAARNALGSAAYPLRTEQQ